MSTTGRSNAFRKEGGEDLVKTMALKAMALSKERADAVRTALLKKHPEIDAKRIEIVGRGWEEPAGTDGQPQPPRRGAVVHAGVMHFPSPMTSRSAREAAPITLSAHNAQPDAAIWPKKKPRARGRRG